MLATVTRSWIPVPGTTTGRLVFAALELFGAHGFAPVTVGSIAERAGVTTGSLYHHFGSKADLYRLVRADVERRVLDRCEGAAAGRSLQTLGDIAPVLLVGFDYLVASGLTRLLAEPAPAPADGSLQPDAIQQFLARVVTGAPPLDDLIAAAWRAALSYAGNDPESAHAARDALSRLLTET
jgi:AcrR family transcriptional regulator